MKIQKLLDKASDCKNEEDASELLSSMKKAFEKSGKLKNLGVWNEEAYMEGDKPFVRFEMNHEISDSYITMIRPEIRDGKFVLEVITNNMLDGHGMSSQSWKVADDMEELLDVDGSEDIVGVSKRAFEKAMYNHASLIEKLGVPFKEAEKLVRKIWKK